MKNLFKALSDFQNEVPIIHEETKGYNYTYSNINTIFKIIKPLLKKHGLGFTQFLNGDSLNTMIYHIESGEKLESSVNLLHNVKLSSMNDYQVLGSGITYLRRYSLSCLLGLITDKDIDANGEQLMPNDVKLKKCKTLSELKAVFSSFSKAEQLEFETLKDELKPTLK